MADSPKPKKETWFSRFLDSLAKANEKQFGGDLPSCCGGKTAPRPSASPQGGSISSEKHAGHHSS